MTGFDLVPPLPCPARSGYLPAGLRTVRYLGGKSSMGGAGKWIAQGLSGVRYRARGYAEPFMGMGGVFLRYPVITREAINDADWRVMTYWRVMRDYPDEFCDLLTDRQEGFDEERWAQCRRIIEEPDTDAVEVAVATFLLLDNSFPPNLCASRYWVYGKVDRNGDQWGGPLKLSRQIVRNLSARMREVDMRCMDGLAFMRECTEADDLVFCDPPYPDTEGYTCGLDQEAFAQWCASVGDGRLIAVVAYDGSYPAMVDAGYRVRLLETHSGISRTGAGGGRHRADRVLAMYLSPRIVREGRV